jgi:predicted thioesterase
MDGSSHPPRRGPLLASGQTTVGTAIRIEHRPPIPVGDSVEILAEPPASASGPRLTFTVRAIVNRD